MIIRNCKGCGLLRHEEEGEEEGVHRTLNQLDANCSVAGRTEETFTAGLFLTLRAEPFVSVKMH